VVTIVRGTLVAAPAGLLVGWLAGLAVRRWHEQNRIPGLTLTLVLPFAGYLLGEHLLRAAGIIAVLCAALSFSYSRRFGTSDHPELYDSVWEFLGSLGSSGLFFALGATTALHVFAVDWAGLLTTILLLLLVRAVVIYGLGPLLKIEANVLPRSWRHVLALGGSRGAIPAALVLMLPPDFPHRNELRALVFVLVAYTVLVHPVVLQRYLQDHAPEELNGRPPQDEEGPEAITALLPPRIAQRLARTGWGLAAVAGVVAGTVFLVLEISLVPLLQGGSPWDPLRMIAAIGLSETVLNARDNSAQILLVASVVHFTLSVIYAWLIVPVAGFSLSYWSPVWGASIGLALYLINFHIFTLLFPWFAESRNALTIFAHLVFGATIATSYRLLHRRLCHSNAGEAQSSADR
jgi:hypothetical protein